MFVCGGERVETGIDSLGRAAADSARFPTPSAGPLIAVFDQGARPWRPIARVTRVTAAY
jgi:hypothetical protein